MSNKIEKRKTNKELYPECWEFFISFARNITQEEDINHLGNYRISIPNKGSVFLYADCPRVLFRKLHNEWYKPQIDSPSVYGKIQYIVETF